MTTTNAGRMTDAEAIRHFMFAGHAVFTIVSPTGTRFTYRVTKADPDGSGFAPPLFVGVLAGPDNETSYAYVGYLRSAQPESGIRRGQRGMDPSDPRVKAIDWYLRHIGDPRVEFWHEGRCGCCGRRLTVPESIASGIGPVCAGRDRKAA